MKRLCFYFLFTLGFFLISCNDTIEQKTDQKSDNKAEQPAADVVKPVRKPVEQPKDHKPGKQKVVIKANQKKDIQFVDVTLESAIADFDKEVVAAKNCEALIRACVNFDKKCKHLCSNDESLTIPIIEKREDVYKIRQFVEEKSSALCITSQIKPNNK